jgi:hypothetical protein
MRVLEASTLHDLSGSDSGAEPVRCSACGQRARAPVLHCGAGTPPAMMFLESRDQGQVKYLAGHFLRLNWLATRRVFRRWPAKLENDVPPEGNCCLSKDPLQLAATQQRPRVLVSLRLNGDSFRGHLRHFTFNANHPTITLIVEPDLSASVSRNPSYRVVVVVPP